MTYQFHPEAEADQESRLSTTEVSSPVLATLDIRPSKQRVAESAGRRAADPFPTIEGLEGSALRPRQRANRGERAAT